MYTFHFLLKAMIMREMFWWHTIKGKFENVGQDDVRKINACFESVASTLLSSALVNFIPKNA